MSPVALCFFAVFKCLPDFKGVEFFSGTFFLVCDCFIGAGGLESRDVSHESAILKQK